MQKSSDSFECRIGICAPGSWQLEITACLEGGLRHGGRDRQPSLLKRHPYHKRATVLYRDCFVTAQRALGWFLSCSSRTPWSILLFGYIQREKTQTQTKRRTQSTRTQKQDCAPLFCVFCNPDCGNYLSGFTRLFFHSKGSFWNRVTLNSV